MYTNVKKKKIIFILVHKNLYFLHVKKKRENTLFQSGSIICELIVIAYECNFYCFEKKYTDARKNI